MNAHSSVAWPWLLLIVGTNVTAQNVTTSQYDNARTGTNQRETTLTPRNVNVRQFGKLFSFKVDGDVYAQPLFVTGLEIPGKGLHDVVFVATEHDSVYAFDAYDHPATPLWRANFLTKASTTVPEDDLQCPFIAPEVGITATPVIDTARATLYVLARTKESSPTSPGLYRQRLHALSLTTGIEQSGSPIDVKAEIRGSGSGSKSGKLAFDALRENARASLVLADGTVYLTWGSSCDVGPYHGWIIAYDAQTLHRKGIFNASPDADSSGFWASDAGPAVDPR